MIKVLTMIQWKITILRHKLNRKLVLAKQEVRGRMIAVSSQYLQ